MATRLSPAVIRALHRQMPGWQIVRNPTPTVPTARPDATMGLSIAQMQRKVAGHITTLDAFRLEYPQLSAAVAQERFNAQLNTRGAVLDAQGRVEGFEG